MSYYTGNHVLSKKVSCYVMWHHIKSLDTEVSIGYILSCVD